MQATVTLSDFDLTEVIDGIEYMSPAPNLRHQDIVANIYYLLSKEIDRKLVVISPYDLEINSKNRVQPDLLVYANVSMKIAKQLPLIVFEVISPSSIITDRSRKLLLYESAGIQEYWIVDPDTDSIEVYSLSDNKYEFYTKVVRQGEIASKALTNLKFQIKDIFN